MTLRIVRNVSLYWRSRAVIACTCAMLAACSNVVVIPSANYNSRVDYLVIHATSEDFAESLRLLTQPTANPVSSHYLVPAPFDPTYPRNDLRVYQLVPELDRAWHAGVSYWAGESALNDRSIGVEVVSEFKCTGTSNPIEETAPEDFECEFPSYDDDQIALLIELLSEILDRFPSIDPIDVVGHSDIAIL
ncbi:MAG: N-acetylmuramoyl-L-alanine amidase, partial [Pseudohongiellaceae bacterium]